MNGSRKSFDNFFWCWIVRYRLKSESHRIELQAFEKVAYNAFLEEEASLSEEEMQNNKIEEVECVLANLISQVSHVFLRILESCLLGLWSSLTRSFLFLMIRIVWGDIYIIKPKYLCYQSKMHFQHHKVFRGNIFGFVNSLKCPTSQWLLWILSHNFFLVGCFLMDFVSLRLL